MTDAPCCDQHLDGPGACCDPDDCGPCCARCPTCPTLHGTVRAGRAYARPDRRRDDRGALDGLLASLVVVVAFVVVIRWLTPYDPLDWLDAVADWVAAVLHDLFADERPRR